jgi:hypothetical protein
MRLVLKVRVFFGRQLTALHLGWNRVAHHCAADFAESLHDNGPAPTRGPPGCKARARGGGRAALPT